MTREAQQFELPKRVDSCLGTLCRLYEHQKEILLQEIVVNGTVTIQEAWEHDNWDGGIDGHAITITVVEDLFLRLLDKKPDLEGRIKSDLDKFINVPHEYICGVSIAMKPIEHRNWRENSGAYRPHLAPIPVSQDAMSRIWNSEHVRVFLSHKSAVKVETAGIKKSLTRCGIAAFVAHDDIEPTEEWQREIEHALFSMDGLVALMSEDFHNSDWTDQEVGVAIGRGVPVIAVRLGRDPYGLMGKGQAVGGCKWTDPDTIALKVFQILFKRLPDKSKLLDCAVASYAKSESWEDSAWRIKNILGLFDILTAKQVEAILKAYQSNPKNKHSFKGMNLLEKLLPKWTGTKWVVLNNELVRADRSDGKQASEVHF